MLKIKTDEVGKTMSLTAVTPEAITLCNIENFNTDPSTFAYNAETGEVYILRNVVCQIEGTLFLITGTEEVADLTIHLVLNGTPIFMLYTGINNQRDFAPYTKGFVAGDVLTFEVTDQSTETIETGASENFITLKRIY